MFSYYRILTPNGQNSPQNVDKKSKSYFTFGTVFPKFWPTDYGIFDRLRIYSYICEQIFSNVNFVSNRTMSTLIW